MKLLADAEEAGLELRRTAKNDTQVFSKDGDCILRIPSTPSSQSTVRRLRAKLEQHDMTKG